MLFLFLWKMQIKSFEVILCFLLTFMPVALPKMPFILSLQTVDMKEMMERRDLPETIHELFFSGRINVEYNYTAVVMDDGDEI